MSTEKALKAMLVRLIYMMHRQRDTDNFQRMYIYSFRALNMDNAQCVCAWVVDMEWISRGNFTWEIKLDLFKWAGKSFRYTLSI